VYPATTAVCISLTGVHSFSHELTNRSNSPWESSERRSALEQTPRRDLGLDHDSWHEYLNVPIWWQSRESSERQIVEVPGVILLDSSSHSPHITKNVDL
jgi:hypothetical protein